MKESITLNAMKGNKLFSTDAIQHDSNIEKFILYSDKK